MVGALLTLFAGNSLFGIWLTERMRQRSATADQKLTDTGQALGGFRDLVGELQEERAALKTEIAELRAENTALKKGRR